MFRMRWEGLIAVALFAAVIGCNGNGPGDNGPKDLTSAAISVDLSLATGQKAFFGASFAGTVADVASMTVDVKNGSSFLAQGTTLENNGGVWSATVNDLPVGPQLTFVGHAYDSSQAEIFTGETFQAMNGANDRVILVMAPAGGDPMLFPRIIQISRPAEITAGSTVPVSFLVHGSPGETLTFALTAAESGGTFSPSMGTLPLNGASGTIVIDYSAPAGTGAFLHSVRLTNSQGNSVEAAFDTTVVPGTAGAEITVQFLPVITGISASRNGSDVTFTAAVNDDGPGEELRFLWGIDNLLTFASTTSNPAVLLGYDDGVSGTLTLTVTDQNGAGGSTTATYVISPGQFPDNVVVDTQPTGTDLPGVLVTGLSSPKGLAIQGNTVFWSENGTLAIRKIDLASMTTATVIGGLGSASDFAVDATHVYWKETGNCVLRKVPVSGGMVQDVLNSLGNVSELVVAGQYVYWVENGPGGLISKVSTSGGMPTVLASGLNNPVNLVVDATSVYWTEQNAAGAVRKVGINGGMVTTLAAGLNQPFDIALVGTTLYWTEYNAAGSVKKVGINGGAVTTLASGLSSPTFLATDGTNVFWTDAGSRTLRKVGTSGGAVTTLASESTFIYGIVLTPTHVIWETSSSNGVLRSLPK